MQNALLISVIVVNWNGRHLLGECLDSVLGQAEGPIEVLVVDNGSRDGSVEFLRSRYGGKIRLIELGRNEGWSGGNNEGIAHAKGDYLLLLNNDACLGERFFPRLREGIGRHPASGMFATKILNYSDRTVIDNTGHVIYWDGAARGRGRLRKVAPEWDVETEVLCPSGAAGVYRKEMIDRVGAVDGDYFAYGEDTELGLRGRMAGYRCHYLPQAVVYHRYSATAGPYTPEKVYYVERNRIWTVVKLFPWYLGILAPFLTLGRYAFGLYGMIARKGAAGRMRESHSVRETASSLLRAYSDALKKGSEMLRKRKEMKRISTLGGLDFLRLLSRFRAGIREVSYNE